MKMYTENLKTEILRRIKIFFIENAKENLERNTFKKHKTCHWLSSPFYLFPKTIFRRHSLC